MFPKMVTFINYLAEDNADINPHCLFESPVKKGSAELEEVLELANCFSADRTRKQRESTNCKEPSFEFCTYESNEIEETYPSAVSKRKQSIHQIISPGIMTPFSSDRSTLNIVISPIRT